MSDRQDLDLFARALRNDWPIPPNVKTRLLQIAINIADKKMRKLTSIGENEDPSWAPDSRHVVIATTRNRAKFLFVLDTKSGRMRQLTHLDGARLAAWSPFLGGDTFLATSATVASVPVSGTR